VFAKALFYDADPSTTERFSRNDTLSLYKHHYLIALDVRLSNDAHTLCISLCLIQFGESSDIYRTHARPRINAVVKIIRALGRTLFEGLHYD